MSDQEDCSLIGQNNTLIIADFNGIPQTLIVNLISWILLFLLFALLRNQAWDYGRLALFNNQRGRNKNWTQVFYRHDSTSSPNSPASPAPEDEEMGGSPINSVSPNFDQGLFAWVPITFNLKADQILRHSGADAIHYLSFQQHLIIVTGFVMIICVMIIFPINYFAGDVFDTADTSKTDYFGKTTMNNLEASSGWLWVHVIVSILFVPWVVLVMRRASGRNAFKTASTRTVMITNISSQDRNKTVIRNYIQELFPDVTIEDVQLAYNISKLSVVNEEYEKVVEARTYCEYHRERDKITARPNPYCSCTTVPAYEYYINEERKLSGEVARLKASSLNKPLDTAFLTVSTVHEAQNIVSHFSKGTYRTWNISFAPLPDDIYWENLSISTKRWYIKWTIVNIVLFVMLFFLTTPTLVLNFVNPLSFITDSEINLSPLVAQFLPTLLLWTLSALMPVIVAFTDKWFQHISKSQQNYSIMIKCFVYLLLMILVLPSLGLESAEKLMKWFFNLNDDEKQRFNCIFLPNRGSFYVNYVITAGFIGTILELIRFPELIVYLWQLATAKSRAETPYIRKNILIEFPFGVHYAWTNLVFTITVVYSVSCPLITPFGFIYLCLKHFNDRHNLYFAYGPSSFISQKGGKIHSTAITMTKVSVVFLLIILAVINSLKSESQPKTIILIIACIVTLGLFTFMSPIKRCTKAKRPSIVEASGENPVYIADVLKPKEEVPTTSGAQLHSPEYGSRGSDTISMSQASYSSVEA